LVLVIGGGVLAVALGVILRRRGSRSVPTLAKESQ
jgi:L-2-hydroxyglutarate oxidase LhgO